MNTKERTEYVSGRCGIKGCNNGFKVAIKDVPFKQSNLTLSGWFVKYSVQGVAVPHCTGDHTSAGLKEWSEEFSGGRSYKMVVCNDRIY